MLTEHFFASVLRPDNPPSQSHLPAREKDAGIYLEELQPRPTLKLTFKKSSTAPNGLAVSRTHVFAAQADKAAVLVYDRATGKQECLVPFPEKVTSLALVRRRGEVDGEGSNSVLALGMAGGAIILWELGTGRQASSAAAHLQAITCLAVDPTYTFLLSGSPDASVHVWAVPSLLSLAPSNEDAQSPIHTLARHQAPITAISIGHSHGSAGIAVTASEDKSCAIWAYRTGALLHTFLFASTPLCLAIDPADRAFLVGCADGSIQLVDFHNRATTENIISTTGITEPQPDERWPAHAGDSSPIHALALTYDGTKAISGHGSGHLHGWDVGTGKIVLEKLALLSGAVTNICMLPIVGLPRSIRETTDLPTVVRPNYAGHFKVPAGSLISVPDDYVLHTRFRLPIATNSAKNSWYGEPRADPLMADFAADGLWPAELLDEDIVALEEAGSSGRPSMLSLLSSQNKNEAEELHALLARSTEESLELRARLEEFGTELVRLRHEDRDRKRLQKIKRVRRAQAEEQRRRNAMDMEGVPIGSRTELPLDDGGSSAASDDLSAVD